MMEVNLIMEQLMFETLERHAVARQAGCDLILFGSFAINSTHRFVHVWLQTSVDC